MINDTSLPRPKPVSRRPRRVRRARNSAHFRRLNECQRAAELVVIEAQARRDRSAFLRGLATQDRLLVLFKRLGDRLWQASTRRPRPTQTKPVVCGATQIRRQSPAEKRGPPPPDPEADVPIRARARDIEGVSP